jgi:trans-aconitate methyltransferase
MLRIRRIAPPPNPLLRLVLRNRSRIGSAYDQRRTSPAILDLGAGTGLLSEFIMQKFPSASLTLLDESAEMLSKAQLRLEHI